MKASGGARSKQRSPAPLVERAAAPESVRTRILRGAVQVFGKHGFGATSVEAILAAAEVSRRTFYKEFRSKEDVLRVLFESSVQLLIAAVQSATDSSGPARERLGAGIEAYLTVHSNAGALARVLLLEQFSPGSPLAAQRDAAMAAFGALLTAGIEREGRSRPDPILVHGVVAAVNQIAVQMAEEYPDGNWDIERAKQAMLRIMLVLEYGDAPLRAADSSQR